MEKFGFLDYSCVGFSFYLSIKVNLIFIVLISSLFLTFKLLFKFDLNLVMDFIVFFIVLSVFNKIMVG